MATRTKLLLNLAAILLLVAATAYVHKVVNEVTNTFIEIRVTDAEFFSKLITDNWDGIKSIPIEKRKILLQNLDPALAGSDLRLMRDLILIVFYCFTITLAIERLVVLFRIWKSSRHAQDAL